MKKLSISWESSVSGIWKKKKKKKKKKIILKKKKKKKKKRNSVHNYIKDSFLRAYIATNQFDIVCLTETFLDRYTQWEWVLSFEKFQ